MGSNQNAPSRQQTLRNTISWSYTLLSEEEQALFRRLCTFVGEFSLETAEAVVTAPGCLSISVLDGILSLIDKSLLQQREEQAHESRLWILEIIRAFGLEQLDESGELELCRQAQALYYLALAERDEEGLRGAGQLALLNQLELEYENLRAAMLWFLEHHEIAAALRLPTALREFWFLRGHLNDGRKFLTRALEASREDDTLKISHLQARALYAAGYLAARQQEPEEAASYLTASLELFLRQEDKGGIAACLSRLGFIEYMRGEVAQGKAMIAESLALSRAIGDRRNSADIRLSLGIGALYEGRFNEARKQLGEGLALFDAEGDVWGKASELHTLGMTFYAQKNYARARQLSEESLTLLRSMDSPYGTAEVLTVLACELVALGEIPRARSLLEEALALANSARAARTRCMCCAE